MDALLRSTASACAAASMSPGTQRAQGADHAAAHRIGDGGNGLEVSLGGGGKPGLDHVYAQIFQGAGNLHLFLQLKGYARRLLAVPQRCIQNFYLLQGVNPLLCVKSPCARYNRTQGRNIFRGTTLLAEICHPRLMRQTGAALTRPTGTPEKRSAYRLGSEVYASTTSRLAPTAASLAALRDAFAPSQPFPAMIAGKAEFVNPRRQEKTAAYSQSTSPLLSR